ncbi:MAG: PAS domain S-box protein [Acidobacteria bacterium]|nr:PAS domain S-box protein [Acidobacteriota bacterium]
MGTDRHQAGSGSDTRPDELQARLAVYSDILRAIRNQEPPARIIESVVASLHTHFSHVRSAYFAVIATGQVQVIHSAGASPGPWPTARPTALSAAAMPAIADADLIETGPTGAGVASAELVSVLPPGDAASVLHAPIRHATTLVGLLSIGATGPHVWSARERTMLREAGDFLGVALRGAEATIRLEESERLFRRLAESSPAVIALHQKEGAVYLNPQFVRLSGYTADELQRTSLWDVIHPDDVEMIRQYRWQWLDRKGAPSSSEARIVTKSGEVHWLDVRASTFELSGKPTILMAGLDITERKLWEQELRAGEGRLRTLMEHLTDGVSLIVDERWVYVNSGLARLAGSTTEALVGQNPVEILSTQDRPHGTARLRSVAAGQTVPPVEYELSRPDGTKVPVLASMQRVELDGRPAILSVLRDLSDQRQLEEQLRQAQRLESVGQLAGGVAHNFNNALAAIIGYSELVARQLDAGDPALADVKKVLVVAEQAASLTRQLLTFSRKERITPTVFSLNEAIEASNALLEPLMGDHVQFRVELDPALRNVRADRSQLEQVIMNLALNARDAMPDGGTLTLATADVRVTEAQARLHPDAVQGAYSRLSATDTGTGMARDTVARIFEPFFTTKEPGQGVGLGLSTVHGAVKQSGGFLTVESELGSGTTFRLYLPIHDDNAEVAGPPLAP